MQALTFMVKRLSQTYDPSVICEAEEILSQSNKELFSWSLCQNVTALAPIISLDNLSISSCNLEELDNQLSNENRLRRRSQLLPILCTFGEIVV